MRKNRALIAAVLSAAALPASALTSDYEISFEGRWTNGLSQTPAAHFTTLAGGTHNAAGSLLSVGQAASPGVEQVAELGGGVLLLDELQARIDAGNAYATILGTDLRIDPQETNTFTITVDDRFPLLTLLTMIAPSPDWFTGVHGLSLVDAQGGWLPRIVLDLNSYDAGTEDGDGFSLNNPDSDPIGVIAPLDAANPNGALFGVGSIARLTITRVLPGDTDGDGDIDDADLGNAIAAFTGPVGAAGGAGVGDGDTDSDGDVDDADLGTAIAGFTGPGVPQSAVPEPGAFALLTLSGLALIARRRGPNTA